MSKNKAIDLNDHLFAQLEKLREEDLKGEDLKDEIVRSRAITDVAKEIIENRRLVLKSLELMAQYPINIQKVPTMLKEGVIGDGTVIKS